MSTTSRALIPLGIFITLAALLFYGLQLDPRKVPSPLIDQPAPTFALQSLKDANQTLTQDILRGKISLVNVWASWCPSCRQEHAELMQIARENDIQVIGFNWKDTRPQALQMLEQFGDPYAIILFDPDNQAGINWGIYGAPETFIVDAQGVIRHKRIGPIDRAVWQNEMLPIIEQYRNK
ncbi:DsbE family thiol:disulfide interchange protein [Chromatium weissei]|nr:DsbE family thiol:disulfide interchange protein [Chromatium weissei]